MPPASLKRIPPAAIGGALTAARRAAWDDFPLLTTEKRPAPRKEQALTTEMERSFGDYFRPLQILSIETEGPLSSESGYFSFEGAVCYGRCAGPSPAGRMRAQLPQVAPGNGHDSGGVALPFDLAEVVNNLRHERYTQRTTGVERATSTAAARRAYYLIRPRLAVSLRKHLQRVRLSGWKSIPFPRWPVDLTVDTLMRTTMAAALRAKGAGPLPFIWFWPDGAESCLMMTHDIEGPAGRDFTPDLMDLDDAFGVRSAFQVVPEWLSGPCDPLVENLRARGFEVNLHDLNHDGSLFRSRKEFETRAVLVNRHARELQCQGFRSGAMYREQDWYDAFEFSYDMSVPNVAHLDPQRGGCCTVKPYFVGDILELPLTTTQDYSLFHILNDYSTALWERQIDTIRSANGLISFITHPDYLVETRARAVYVRLLEHLSRLRSQAHLWTALPAEVDRWWRNRQQMTLVSEGDCWVVKGPDCERARVAYPEFEDGELVYRMAPKCDSRFAG